MIIGLDVGYSEVKLVRGVGERDRVIFPSVVGTPDQSRFGVDDKTGMIILEHPRHVQVGLGAISQSKFVSRREDRNWIESKEWYDLFLAAMSEISQATSLPVNIVTGLPLAYYDERDKDAMKHLLIGRHTVQRLGRPRQEVIVNACRVVPQPFGTLLSVAMDDNGDCANVEIAGGKVGVLDVGGKTTNILYVTALSEQRRKSTSVELGAWDIVRAMRDHLIEAYPGTDLRDHEIAALFRGVPFSYKGHKVDVMGEAQEMLRPMAEQVIAEATKLWNGAVNMDAVLITGGGAYLIGKILQEYIKYAKIVDDPVIANALGYWRYARRLWM